MRPPIMIRGQRQESKTDLNKIALAVWRHADPYVGTLADRYLRTRAIVPEGINARFDPRCQCGAGAAKAFAPALIVPIEEDAGVVAIHRTFLTPDGRWKADMPEPKRMLGNPGTGAVRWGGIPTDGVLRLAEGVEGCRKRDEPARTRSLRLAGAGHRALSGHCDPESIHTVILYSQHGVEAARAVRTGHPSPDQ
ncbi:DUF7146 domain-containing protein [Novosphingobium resinovorum]|uniref:DUF7146 domain-containing protein n=1 Tax=Novosphingobium resinovorum TaxID=158500 RepID=UPI003D284314